MLCEWPVGGCTMNEDWEQVTPFLHDMQHCAEEDYFNPQEVSETLKAPERFEKKKKLLLPFRDCGPLALPSAAFEHEIIKRY